MITPIDSFISQATGRAPRKPGPKKRVFLPDSIDWSRTYRELAEDFDCSTTMIQREFKERFPANRKHARKIPPDRRPFWEQFKAWDWTRRDSDLAKAHGYTRERVRQIRQTLGKPKIRKAWRDYENFDWTLSNRELSEASGVCLETIKTWRRRLGKTAPDRIAEALAQITPQDWASLTRREILAKLRQINPKANHYWLARAIADNPKLRRPSRWDK